MDDGNAAGNLTLLDPNARRRPGRQQNNGLTGQHNVVPDTGEVTGSACSSIASVA